MTGSGFQPGAGFSTAATSGGPPGQTGQAATAADVLEMYRRMLRIRLFEEEASRLYRDGHIPGFLHLSIGQEAAAVGACWHLEQSDVITSTHRGHGHCLAKGMDSASMFAELLGRETGTCHGRSGSMHIADPQRGVFGANGIVAAGLPIAVGAATAAHIRRDGRVAVAFFGDGATAQGMFHEAVNLAAVWRLPVAFFCENNHFSEFSRAEAQTRAGLRDRATGYGIRYRDVDGNDVVAVASLMDEELAQLRQGNGPVLIEADTYRWRGHYEGDPERYRTAAEGQSWRERDPLAICLAHLDQLGADAAQFAVVQAEVRDEIHASIDAALVAPQPLRDDLLAYVYAERPHIEEPPAAAGEPFKLMDAVREAIEHEMVADPNVWVAGIDVGAGGNVFALFRGLAERFPGRFLDTPISESAIVGCAVGAAMAGARPVVEIMYMDFIGVCLDALVNQAAKLQFMTGGGTQLPLVVRTQTGAGRSSGSQHSQSLEAVLAHIPGLTVVMPSSPADAYGLLRAAIHDPNPVIFIEHRLQYGRKGPRPQSVDHLIPLGKARIVRPGTSVTVVSYSRMLQESVAVAETLAVEGIDVEVVDLRTIVPLDRQTILESLERTNRLVIVHEAVQDFGVGAEIAALAVNEGFWHLDAPVRRVAPPYTPVPYSPELESAWLPDQQAIATAIRSVVSA
jgi:2-oxoisovalerate dehydrogenase E1 component